MNLPAEQQREFAQFPEVLRALVEAELAAGNTILEFRHGHPAPPVGASIMLANKVSTRARESGDGLDFYERNSSIYSGEFTDAKRFFFVLEPPNPPPPEPDMDAIRKAHEPRPTMLDHVAQRSAGTIFHTAPEQPSPRAARTGARPVRRAFTNTETATGWTRLLHFRDTRTPDEVQFALERELMVLFTVNMDNGGLRMNATASVNGARYEFELRFLAASKSGNHFSLRIEASWPDSHSAVLDYFRKTSDGWYHLWTRDLMTATPPARKNKDSAHYRNLCEAALRAKRDPVSVAEVQRAIVDGVKRGGSFGNSHKEGGTNIGWRNGKFFRSDYGDYPDFKEFDSEPGFLGMLWNFCQFDVTRSTGRQALPELDAWKLILRRMNPPPAC